MNPTTFHLIRHTTYDLLGHTLTGRSPGHRLNERGRAQAQALAEELAAHAIAAVVSSPLERTRETAEAIAKPHGLVVDIEPGLTEIDCGQWTGMSFEAMHGDPVWREFNTFRSTLCPPGGETMLAAQLRAMEVVMRLRERWPGQELVVVTHGDVVKVVLAHFLGVPLDLFQRIEISPASRSVVRLFATDVRVDGVNLPLRGGG
ncbi:MAG: histidine phosphatase family protein [Acetobacteraceae bacterium]|nr:histidine phosphatase family protein [Acetobacteraceae bacterium]